jgi:hypothetical protein
MLCFSPLDVAIFQFELHKQRSYLLLKWRKKLSVVIAAGPVGPAI